MSKNIEIINNILVREDLIKSLNNILYGSIEIRKIDSKKYIYLCEKFSKMLHS